MTHIFSNRKVFAAIAVLFAAAAVLQNVEGETPAAPSGLTLMELFQPDAHNVGIETLASGQVVDYASGTVGRRGSVDDCEWSDHASGTVGRRGSDDCERSDHASGSMGRRRACFRLV